MSLKILVVDDSAIVRQQAAFALFQAGFEVIEAVDGQDAMEKLGEVPDVALVLCDINMPRKNGIELLLELSKSSNGQPPPFLMLTTEGDPELVKRAKGLGAKGWMVKPVRPDLLVATVKKLTGG